MNVLNDIPVYLDVRELSKWLYLKEEGKYLNDVQELVVIANSVIKPKAIYKISYVDNKNDNTLNIDGISLNSRVLRIILDKAERIFPYIVTIRK